ncbi:hypothetical protein GOP47_0002880 [Adiantum capillus-veneris]|uniref:Uncharacterized protein n=1 Tax=Adiantum capillus-veneris TaxID=13818 RepID=A0A9D4ZRQ0_ADICA|nr:hypothetical protein GOP47_0002880 [Adiantum capillus-veneris]
MCRPRPKGHADLMSSPPSSGLSLAVYLGFQTCHAPPVSAFPKALPSFKRIHSMSSPATAGTELADAYSSDIITASSLRKGVYDLWAFCLHTTLLRQDFAHCRRFPIAASRRSLGRVSIPVSLIILSDHTSAGDKECVCITGLSAEKEVLSQRVGCSSCILNGSTGYG